MATAQALYTVIKADDIFELREYTPQSLPKLLLTEVWKMQVAKAFRPQFRYISGGNKLRGKIAMTAPVSREQTGEKIAMSALVSQQWVQGKWPVSFMMPASYTIETLPTPYNPDIKLARSLPDVYPLINPCNWHSHKSPLDDGLFGYSQIGRYLAGWPKIVFAIYIGHLIICHFN